MNTDLSQFICWSAGVSHHWNVYLIPLQCILFGKTNNQLNILLIKTSLIIVIPPSTSFSTLSIDMSLIFSFNWFTTVIIILLVNTIMFSSTRLITHIISYQIIFHYLNKQHYLIFSRLFSLFSSHLISSYLILFHLISSHLISSYSISSHLISSHLFSSP